VYLPTNAPIIDVFVVPLFSFLVQFKSQLPRPVVCLPKTFLQPVNVSLLRFYFF
jgi:hypothetical protein